MRVYEKPALTLLTVSANDALCSGCMVKTRDSDDAFIKKLNGKYGGADGILDPSDMPFTIEDSCTTAIEEIDVYCKFIGASQLFTS